MLKILKIYEWFYGLSKTDWILFFTLIVLSWYSLETHFLRRWQKKQVQLSILNAEIDRFKNHSNLGGLSFKIPVILRKIYELEKLDLRELYIDKNPLKRRDKISAWFKKVLQRFLRRVSKVSK